MNNCALDYSRNITFPKNESQFIGSQSKLLEKVCRRFVVIFFN